ncbi:SSU ribosomal protein S16P [Magnetococcus marinus MC-1]|uniref:Small ribosomal subunit protein bS16 n=1 Tax=Magnetococcus marinus (strain ATCC BAA-1437 / JCM 17883 / MC-1) TaxID=156889 RepID=RS16_MAGMM|nr:30S ribosomal protein S16 [Magnetococcus marinus]A0L4Y6.1 RecName: Full=Small ribosomal subunit protein bS16; AltName: Full=30S ribosomal protein S16 [Magnetococcus marinus MC-1]ABK43029.1 SSU ribosomal protein S16P [Magnetococcus marinus MC-1]
MAVCIRLARGGKKKKPVYSVVVADKRMARDGRFLEKLGQYIPMKEGGTFAINQERYAHWISQGAKPSETVGKLVAKQQNAAEA